MHVVGTRLGPITLNGFILTSGVGSQIAPVWRDPRAGGLELNPAELVKVDLYPSVRVASGDDARLLPLIFHNLTQCETDDESAREVVESCQRDEGRGEVGTLAATCIKEEAVNRVFVLPRIIHVQVIKVVRAQVAHNCLRLLIVRACASGDAGA